jgi:hypothetical protein
MSRSDAANFGVPGAKKPLISAFGVEFEIDIFG